MVRDASNGPGSLQSLEKVAVSRLSSVSMNQNFHRTQPSAVEDRGQGGSLQIESGYTEPDLARRVDGRTSQETASDFFGRGF